MDNRSDVYQRIETAGLKLRAPGKPAATYVPFVEAGKLLFISGHIARREGQTWAGQLGHDTDTATGVLAARAVGEDLLGTLHAATGDLARIRRIVKVLCLVNSSATFTEHHLVANGCSELLEHILGDAGKHARSAFGVAQLPTGACVEVELIAELN